MHASPYMHGLSLWLSTAHVLHHSVDVLLAAQQPPVPDHARPHVLPASRVRDTCIVVAVDEPPEEGLEQPLRLEKLANEVHTCSAVAATQHSSNHTCR